MFLLLEVKLIQTSLSKESFIRTQRNSWNLETNNMTILVTASSQEALCIFRAPGPSFLLPANREAPSESGIHPMSQQPGHPLIV